MEYEPSPQETKHSLIKEEIPHVVSGGNLG